jgi:DNA-directed RNA polymerase subunit RPC12/RpoP
MRFSQRQHLEWHKKAHLLCNTCHKEINQTQDLQGHYLQDEATGKYICSKCSKKTLNLSKLLQHIARQHGTNTFFQCGLCRELESTEPTGMGYICCQCDIEFDIASNLESHMLTHCMAK